MSDQSTVTDHRSCPRGHIWQDQAETTGVCPVCGSGALTPIRGIVPDTEKLGGGSHSGTLSLPIDPNRLGGTLAPEGGTPGALAVGGYEIQGLLGEGGMGVVYKAKQRGLDRLVALKMIKASSAEDPEARARFKVEAGAVARLRHPSIVQIYEVGEHNGQPFFSLEYVEGGSLKQKLRRGPLAPRQAAQMVEALAQAMHCAHQRGILHRDLKPANILLATDGTPKVTDFGLAKHSGTSLWLTMGPLTQTGDILGTPCYMAPEQAAGRVHDLGPPCDIYALGAILYELLTGHVPFEGSTTMEILHKVIDEEPPPLSRWQPHLPRDLQVICLSCLEKNPARRYATAMDLAEDLQAFLTGEPIRARPVGRWERLKRWMKRHPGFAVGLAGGLAAVLGLFLGALWYNALAVSAVAVLGLALGAAGYSASLRHAYREAADLQLRAERGRERVNLLLEATTRLIRTRTKDELLQLLTETTSRLVGAERATIFLVDAASQEIWSKVAMGKDVGEIRLPIGQGIAGTVAATGEILLLADPYTDPRFHAQTDTRTGFVTRNMVTVPITAPDGRILGVLQALNKQGGPFSQEDVDLLSALANSAAVAVEQVGGREGKVDLPA